MLLGIVKDYRKEASFTIDLNPVSSSEIVDHLNSYIQRTEPGARRNTVDNLYLDAINVALNISLKEIILRAAEELIEFIYRVIVESRRRSFREMYVATRDAQSDGEFLRQRVLDYLTLGDVSQQLEALIDETIDFAKWENELNSYSLDDIGELRGNTARLLSSNPTHPGLLYARAYAELVDPNGDMQDFGANFRFALTSAIDYGVEENEIEKFVNRTLNLIQEKLFNGLPIAIEVVQNLGIATNSTNKILQEHLRKPDGDPGVKIMALADSLTSISSQIENSLRSNRND